MSPEEFQEVHPQYVYRNGKGHESVQWRQAALEMADSRRVAQLYVERDRKLVDALKRAIASWWMR